MSEVTFIEQFWSRMRAPDKECEEAFAVRSDTCVAKQQFYRLFKDNALSEQEVEEWEVDRK